MYTVGVTHPWLLRKRSTACLKQQTIEAKISTFLAGRDLATAEDFRESGEGWTIVLNQVHGASPILQGLHHALWAALGVSGGVNSYLTPPGAVGKAPHVDEHDVLVLQQHGEKRWFLLAEDMRTVVEEVCAHRLSGLRIRNKIFKQDTTVSCAPNCGFRSVHSVLV